MTELLTDLTLEYLKETRIGETIQKVLPVFQKVQETLLSYLEDEDPDHLKQIRTGTVLTFVILSKVAAGKKLKEFNEEDWEEIIQKSADYAVNVDPQLYSRYIFSLYANYVDISADYLQLLRVPEAKCNAIKAIAKNVRELGEQLDRDEILETVYTENCLWQLLEAMIKLLAGYSSIFLPKDTAEFAESLAAFAFEYGRYMLYKREQEILESYISHQYEIDDELSRRFADFRKALQERQEEFMNLISEAFDSDIMTRLRATAEIARNAGVEEEEILDSVEKIDEFFL